MNTRSSQKQRGRRLLARMLSVEVIEYEGTCIYLKAACIDLFNLMSCDIQCTGRRKKVRKVKRHHFYAKQWISVILSLF